MLSCSFPKGVRQGSKHARPYSSCQFTMPFSIDEATGQRDWESCQQRRQWKSGCGSRPKHHSREGKAFPPQSPHSTFGANSDPSTAPPDLAAYCTVGPLVIYLDAYCPYFLGTVMGEDVLLEDLGVGGSAQR